MPSSNNFTFHFSPFNLLILRYLTVAVAAVTVAVPWVAALWLLDSQGWWSVPAWLFVGGKGLMILTTAVATAVRPRLAIQLFAGRYRFDSHSLHGLLQAFTRYVWELPQTAIGYLFSQWRVALGRAKRVVTVHGVTFVASRHRQPHTTAGLSLGCFVQMWLPRRAGEECERWECHDGDEMARHEYGHTVDSQLWGWLYLPVIGLPSLISQALGLSSKARHRHDNFWAERRADRLGKRFFTD